MYTNLNELHKDTKINDKSVNINKILNKVYNSPNDIFDNNKNNDKFVKKTEGAQYWENGIFKIGEF